MPGWIWVLDSDGAQLVDYSPRAGRWGGWLGLYRIIGHVDDDAMPYGYEDENGEFQSDEGEESPSSAWASP